MKYQGIVPFNRARAVGSEFGYIQQAIDNMAIAGNGVFTKRCQGWLDQQVRCSKSLLTHSCTAALEMSAILADIGPGDEVVMPSFTFVSTANAFVLRGGVPVFVDIRPDTLNLDEALIESAITPRTKAIVVVHYAGVGCEMDAILAIARKYGLLVVEDAAQGLMAYYKNRPLGGIAPLGVTSFHETKNVTSGEGGALFINDPLFAERAEIIWEKGTNRARFFRGQVDKYTWVDAGSSFLPSEITAAFLWGQLEEAEWLTSQRLAIWSRYYAAFADLERGGMARRPVVPDSCRHNAHMFYLLLQDLGARTRFIERLKTVGVNAVFHYVSLHSSPAGLKYGRACGELPNTQRASDCLVRLPLWVGMTDEQVRHVIASVHEALG